MPRKRRELSRYCHESPVVVKSPFKRTGQDDDVGRRRKVCQSRKLQCLPWRDGVGCALATTDEGRRRGKTSEIPAAAGEAAWGAWMLWISNKDALEMPVLTNFFSARRHRDICCSSRRAIGALCLVPSSGRAACEMRSPASVRFCAAIPISLWGQTEVCAFDGTRSESTRHFRCPLV